MAPVHLVCQQVGQRWVAAQPLAGVGQMVVAELVAVFLRVDKGIDHGLQALVHQNVVVGGHLSFAGRGPPQKVLETLLHTAGVAAGTEKQPLIKTGSPDLTNQTFDPNPPAEKVLLDFLQFSRFLVLVGLAFQKLLIGGPQQVLQRLRILPALARFHNPSSQSTELTKTDKTRGYFKEMAKRVANGSIRFYGKLQHILL
jgi:hypothetical protein